MRSRSFGFLRVIVVAAAILGLAMPAWAAEAPILKMLKGAEKARVAKLIAGAKKEGSFSWATNLAPVKAAKALEKDFKKFYGLPGVKFRFANRKSGTLIKRFEQEIRANKLSVDVVAETSSAAR